MSSKLKKLKINFEDKTSLTIKISESDEPINSDSASEDENNGTEESETSDDQYLSDFTRLQPYMYEPSVSKESMKKNCREKKH